MDIKEKVSKRRNNLSIGTRLTLTFVITSVIIIMVNIFMHNNINKTIEVINDVYISNVNLNELTEKLLDVQNNMKEYLKTKSSDVLEDYYRSENDYSNLIDKLNGTASDNNVKLMEKNIKSMSSNYLLITNRTIQAKRGRDIEKYKVGYEESSEIYDYIKANIYSLNNEQFKNNSSNYELLLVSLKYLEMVSTIILIIISLINIILIAFMTKSMIKPLSKLALAANEVATGNFDIELSVVNYNDEIGTVAKAFDKMIVSIREYVLKIKESLEFEIKAKENELLMKTHLKDAQIKCLQAQINPHFLFNTLNAGAQMAMMEGAEQTSIFIEKVAIFFRYNIKKMDEDAKLEEEIELVNNYIYIMNVRFAGKIHFLKEIDDTLIGIRVPSMILQPIVENAVSYGIRDVDWDGIIKLSVYSDQDNICISIKDNGKGISQRKIERIIQGEEKSGKNSNGIGLGNVMSRLRLYCGKDNIVEIKSDGENMGTEVLIRIPDEKR